MRTAKFTFSQASSLAQLTKAIQALITDYKDGFEFAESQAAVNESEKIDALEVNTSQENICLWG